MIKNLENKILSLGQTIQEMSTEKVRILSFSVTTGFPDPTISVVGK